MEEIMLKIENVSKMYKLGQIGETTLRDELQRLRAKRRGEEDPTREIGAKNYNQGETFMALNGVLFEVKKGERVGIIGHNGAGKSTLLKLISRVTAPTGGTISLNGRVASMLEVGTGFHGELTGRENIYMNGAILGMTKAEIDSKMEDIIDFSECRQFIDTPVKRYSSGMYVKLAFSVAAHLDSEIMIMDEVLAVGDMAFQKKCLDKMNDVSKTQGRTILYVSHNMNTIRELCERVVVLDHGKVIFDGDVEEGIETYLKNSYDEQPDYDYEKIPQLRLRGSDYLKILSAEYVDKDCTAFTEDEDITIRIKWKNLKRIEGVSFRVEVRGEDGRTPIGTCLANDLYSGNENETVSAIFTIPVQNLVVGRYTCAYVFYQVGELGAYANIDYVRGLNFEIVKNNSSEVWNKKWWGSVRFPNIIVNELKVNVI